MKLVTKAELDALELLEKAATPGPFTIRKLTHSADAQVWRQGHPGSTEECEANAQLFVESRNALPRLIADHRRLVELLHRAIQKHKDLRTTTDSLIAWDREAAKYLRQWEGNT